MVEPNHGTEKMEERAGDLVGRSKRKKKKREGRTIIRIRSPATTMEKTTRKPAAAAMATTVGEWWRDCQAPFQTQQAIDNIPIYTKRRGLAHLPLTTGETPEEERKGAEVMGSR